MRKFDAERPAANVHLVRAVVQGFAGAVAAQPVPVIGMDIGPVFTARRGTLPKIPIEFGRRGAGLAVMRGAAGVGIPRFGHVGVADEAVVNLLDHIPCVLRGALLIADLDEFAVFLLRGNNEFAFARILARGFFDVNMLARLEAENRHGRVPVVRAGDGDGIHLLRLEHATEIALGFGRVAKHLFRLGGEFRQDSGIDVAYVGHAGGFAVGVQRRQVCIATAVQTVDGKIETVVGAQNLRIALCCGCESRSRHSCGQAVDKITPGNHCILQSSCSQLQLSAQYIPQKRLEAAPSGCRMNYIVARRGHGAAGRTAFFAKGRNTGRLIPGMWGL